MKNHSHLFRMNPQATRRRSTFSAPTLIGTILLGAFGILYWIGKIHTK